MMSSNAISGMDERMAYDDTQYDGAQNAGMSEEDSSTVGKGTWKKVAIGTTTGLVFGAASTLLTSSVIEGGEAEAAEGTENETANNNHDALSPGLQPIVDESVMVASTVDDSMSFSEAFGAARAEVGPGGVFEWHGRLYGTYYADEWDNMSAAEREAYNDQFAWSSGSHSDTQGKERTVAKEEHHDNAAQTGEQAGGVAQEEQHNNTAQTGEQTGEVDITGEVETVPDIEVLGVVHDTETGMNVGGILVDGQEYVMLDVDNDGYFDVVAADHNQNGTIERDELEDISGEGIAVDRVAEMANQSGGDLANNNEPDYTNDDSSALV